MHEIGMMERYVPAWQDVDAMYEAYTDRLYEEICEDQEDDREEAFNDVAGAIEKLKEANKMLDEATKENIDESLRAKIGSYFDEVTDLISYLEKDLEGWESE